MTEKASPSSHQEKSQRHFSQVRFLFPKSSLQPFQRNRREDEVGDGCAVSTHHCSATRLTRKLRVPRSIDEVDRISACGEKHPEGVKTVDRELRQRAKT